MSYGRVCIYRGVYMYIELILSERSKSSLGVRKVMSMIAGCFETMRESRQVVTAYISILLLVSRQNIGKARYH